MPVPDPSNPSESISFKDVAQSLSAARARIGAPAPTGATTPKAPAAATPPAPLPAPAPAPEPEAPASLTGTAISPRHQLEAWLALMVKNGASDLILRAGGRPSLRTDGKIAFLPGRVPNPGALLEVLEGILSKERIDDWRAHGSTDAALNLDGLGRFRMNAYRQLGEPAVVLRRISQDAPSIDQLDLPSESLKSLAARKRGLILVTGVAGSGKSTTLAAMIQHMNEKIERHVVTLEDPVELLFTEKRCVISQREVGTDCSNFREGLRHALRQSPDVILIGEMRDRETMEAALSAAETGHLVMATLHTVNAIQTVERILSFFPPHQHQLIRQQMSLTLKAIMSMRLIPRMEGFGRVPAIEILFDTPRIKELLLEGNTKAIAQAVYEGKEHYGTQTFNQALHALYKQGLISFEDALLNADNPDELKLEIRGITKGKGGSGFFQ